MIDLNSMEKIVVEKKLTVTEQIEWRLKLRDLIGQPGIYNIRLNGVRMIIEFNPLRQNRASIVYFLKRIEYPANQVVPKT